MAERRASRERGGSFRLPYRLGRGKRGRKAKSGEELKKELSQEEEVKVRGRGGDDDCLVFGGGNRIKTEDK